MPKTVLFLCTGNYYRSRFAEVVFNDRAARRGLPWRAESRGLALERGVNNVGPLSRHASTRLEELGLPFDDYLRLPLAVCEDDLRRADLIVGLKEVEHRPLMAERHPGWAARAEFWEVHDEYDVPPEEALAEIERAVEGLLDRLAAMGGGGL
jgi:low molecular weight protein-tyrosine phosphatase